MVVRPIQNRPSGGSSETVMRPSVSLVDFVMSSPKRLRATVQQLREAGYPDAAESTRRADGQKLVLSVSTDAGCHMQVEWIVTGEDPESRLL